MNDFIIYVADKELEKLLLKTYTDYLKNYSYYVNLNTPLHTLTILNKDFVDSGVLKQLNETYTELNSKRQRNNELEKVASSLNVLKQYIKDDKN